MVKEFWPEAAAWGQIFTGEKLIWHRPVRSNAVDCSSIADAVIECFAAYTSCSSDSQYIWMGRTTPSIAPSSFPWRDLDHHLIHSSLGSPASALFPQTASRSVQPFLQGSRTWPTDRHTDKPRYFVCSNRPNLAIVAMRPAVNCMRVRYTQVQCTVSNRWNCYISVLQAPCISRSVKARMLGWVL